MSKPAERLATLSRAAKDYYSVGTVVSSITLPACVGIAWLVIMRLAPFLPREIVLFTLCVVGSYIPAFLLPEPPGYQDEGKLRLTINELVFGFFNACVLFAAVLGATCWLGAQPPSG